MPKLVRNPDPRKKPPYGSRLDPYHPLSQGLVGCWLMNEGGGDKVYNVARLGSFNLTASGDFSFKGGDGLFGGTDGSLSVGPVKVDDDLSAYHRETTIVANFKFNSIVNLAPIFFRDGDIGFRPNSSNPEYFIWGCNAIGTTVLTTGTEYQVALVFDGNITVKGYLNGTIETSLTNGNTQQAFDNDFEVGSRTTLSLYFNGVIKNLSYYRGMLTDSEILQLYEEPYGHVLVPQYWYMVDFGAAGGQTASLTDSLTLSETLSVLASYKATLADTFATSDASQTLAHLIASISDTTSVTDARTALRHLKSALSDSFITTDARLSLAHLKASTDDTASFSDQLQVTASFKASTSDTISFTDSFQAILAALATLADTISLTDELTYPLGQTASLTDTFSLTDSQTAVAALKAAVTDTLTLSDTQTALAALKTILTDTLSLSDELSTQLIGHIEDTLALSDSTTAVASFLATLIDTFVGADTLDGTLHLQVTLSDTLTLGEQIQALAHYALALADALNLTDSITGIKVEATGIVTITFGTKFPGVSISAKQPGATITGKGPSEDIT